MASVGAQVRFDPFTERWGNQKCSGEDAVTEKVMELCDLFADVLGVAGIEPQDDFFDLNGHSLLTSKLIKQVHERYGVRISLRSFYENPTAQAVATHLDQAA